ncbi:MAG: S46 family peptidase, partial [Rhodothermales bacterium]|nr:S46 family peptidase [Rhodothermales bacterium]
VGLAFDGNIEFLPSAFIFDTSAAGRTVSVDSRGMMEALDVIYDMDRLVLELQDGKFVPTEEEADALRAG